MVEYYETYSVFLMEVTCRELITPVPNIWNAYHEVNTIFVDATNLITYYFEGELKHSSVKFPKSWHDFEHPRCFALVHFHPYNNSSTPKRFALLGNSAFKAGQEVDEKHVKRRK